MVTSSKVEGAIVQLMLFSQGPGKDFMLAVHEGARASLYDLGQHDHSKALIYQSPNRKPILEGANKINQCLKTLSAGALLDPGAVNWVSPEIALATNSGLYFMNVRVSKFMPKMNSIYLKDDEHFFLGQNVVSLA